MSETGGRILKNPIVALLVTGAIAVAATYAARAIGSSGGGFVPPSFTTHTVILVLSVALAWVISGGRPELFGLGRGSYRFSPRILLWVLPTAALSTAALVAGARGSGAGPTEGMSRLQLIVFVWVYASVCEEVLTRGLLQTLLDNDGRSRCVRRRGLGMPVVVGALFFAAMHLVLVRSMGPAAVPVIVLTFGLGLVAGRYRERTGSLIPAIIVHALFNIGAMTPAWIAGWLASPGL